MTTIPKISNPINLASLLGITLVAREVSQAIFHTILPDSNWVINLYGESSDATIMTLPDEQITAGLACKTGNVCEMSYFCNFFILRFMTF